MLKLTPIELARVRVEALKLANAANPESTTFRAALYEDWILRDGEVAEGAAPAEGEAGKAGDQSLLDKTKQTLGLGQKNK